MDTQTLVVFLIVALALGFLLRRGWKKLTRGKDGGPCCGKGCGCPGAALPAWLREGKKSRR